MSKFHVNKEIWVVPVKKNIGLTHPHATWVLIFLTVHFFYLVKGYVTREQQKQYEVVSLPRVSSTKMLYTSTSSHINSKNTVAYIYYPGTTCHDWDEGDGPTATRKIFGTARSRRTPNASAEEILNGPVQRRRRETYLFGPPYGWTNWGTCPS